MKPMYDGCLHKKCGTTLKYASGECVVCKRLRNAINRAVNPVANKEYRIQWLSDHPDYHNNWYHAHPEKKAIYRANRLLRIQELKKIKLQKEQEANDDPGRTKES